MKLFVAVTSVIFLVGGGVLFLVLGSGEPIASVSSSEEKIEVAPALTKQKLIETQSGSPSILPPLTYKRISRKFTNVDRIVLGEDQYVDSRASRRMTENRMLSVIDLKRGLNVRKRVEQMRSLSALSSEEQETLYAAMLQDELPEGISRPSWNWMVDVMMITLRTQGADVPMMVERFSEVASTERVDFTVRDYAIQHLGHLKGEGADVEVVDAVLSDALQVTEATIAGTALLALNNGLDSSKGIDDDRRIQRANQAAVIAADTSYSLESRVTALQVAVRHDPSSVAPLAEQIVAQTDAPEILKLSAQAVLRQATN